MPDRPRSDVEAELQGVREARRRGGRGGRSRRPKSIIDFGPEEALRAANLYRQLRRTRGREIDLAIAACALAWDAPLWTLNGEDFRDVPGLRLYG